MKDYFLSLFLAAAAVALVGILSPGKPSGGISRHIRLLSSLFLLCVLLSPITGAIDGILHWIQSDEVPPLPESAPQTNYEELASNALDDAAKRYFSQMLGDTVAGRFSIPPEELHCAVEWGLKNGSPAPTRVTVVLSGSAIWRDPAPLKAAVQELLGCPCDIAIDSNYIGGNA